MSFSRNKILLSFALFGFLVGSATYFVFDWLIANSTLGLRPIPILEVISAPWFLSGIAGSLLSIVAVYASAHLSKDN